MEWGLGGRPARRPIGATLAVGILGVAVWLGLSLATPMAPPEAGSGVLAQAVFSDPIPSFLAPGFAVREAPGARRGLVPTDPPRVLVVPTVTTGGTQAAATTGGIPVRVFFSRRPDSERSASAVFPVTRVAPDRAVATAALAALIDGPNAAERADGYSSELHGALTGPSTCSGRDFRIAIEGGTASVRFCRAVASAGVGQDARMRSQIEATLRQFPTIRAVRLLDSHGRCLFDGHGPDGCTAGRAAAAPEPRAGAR
jgi:Sporulation and spore germination